VIVKICGITRQVDADVAAEAGADWIGLNFWPGSKRRVTIDAARGIRTPLHKVGVFVNATLDEIRRAVEEVGLDRIQLHGDEPADFWAGPPPALRVARGLDALSAGEGVVLLDAATPGYGGAGEPLDWELVRAAVEKTRREIILAGGLTPANVAEAVRVVRPAGVDVASGVESSPGIKDAEKIRAFVTAARGA
jgi:phosphoribosylanthranilate isomerase